MTLNDLQTVVDQWITDHGGYRDKSQILTHLTEGGGISSASQRIERLRPCKSDAVIQGKIGDLLFTLAAFSIANKVSLSAVFDKVMNKYQIRYSPVWKGMNN